VLLVCDRVVVDRGGGGRDRANDGQEDSGSLVGRSFEV
jgi:hypothetical protein